MDTFLGQIALFPFSFTPQGWMACDGRTLSIAQNSALFALVGYQFGGDGRRTFALPKLAPLHVEGGQSVRYFIATEGIYPSQSMFEALPEV